MEDKKCQEQKEEKYLHFEPYFSKDNTYDNEGTVHRLFDETLEQISHGTAPWDKYGWSRDGWVI